MAEVLAEAEVDWDQVTFIPFGESMMETINNEPLTTSITATKQWLDMNGEQSPAAELPESITLTLYQHFDGTKTVYGDTVTVIPDENGDWEYTWENLPRKDDEGHYYAYSVEETAIGDGTDMDGYEISYRYPNDGNADTGIEQGEIRITNTRIGPLYPTGNRRNWNYFLCNRGSVPCGSCQRWIPIYQAKTPERRYTY